MLSRWKKIKSVHYAMDHWIMSIIPWKNGISGDSYAVNVIHKKSLKLIQELMKE